MVFLNDQYKTKEKNDNSRTAVNIIFKSLLVQNSYLLMGVNTHKKISFI